MPDATRQGAKRASTAPFDRERDFAVDWRDRLVAVGLSLAYLAVLLATLGIGYTRDESYYFRYGQAYQDWFTALGEDRDEGVWGRNLEREPVVRTWSQNFEHPPLMKTLFGWSWAALSAKVRPLSGAEGLGRGDGESANVTVRDLGRSDGFAVGAPVLLLPPQGVGEPRGAEGALAGEVVERSGRTAAVRVSASPPVRAAFAAACGAAEVPGRPLLRGCSAVEDRVLALFGEGNATRFPALLFAAALIGLVYLFGVRLGGRWVGGFAALSFALLPRGFFHAHLAAFDVPVTTMLLLTLYAFWRSQWSRGWAVATAFVWGFALLTKHNAFFTPVFLVVYWLVAGRRGLRVQRAALGVAAEGPRWPLLAGAVVLTGALTLLLGAAGLALGVLAVPLLLGWRLRLPRIPLAFVLMPPIGLLLLFLLWPKLWFDPLRAFRDYVAFHLNHEHYMQYYFGRILEVPPFPVTYPFVMTAVTVPVLTLAAFLLGSVVVWGPPIRAFADRLRRLGGPPPADPGAVEYASRVRTFLAVNLLFPIALIAMPNTPIFGGIKHWLPAMPFFAIIAGMGFDRLRRRLAAVLVDRGMPRRRTWLAPLFGAALLLVVLAPAAIETARAHPFGTGYYNALLGGVQGAARHRMQRQFWGYATRQTFPRLNRVAPKNARIFFQNTTHDAFVMYRRDGVLRQDLRYAWGPKDADVALFEHQKSFSELEFEIWQEMGTIGPAWQATLEGVPMVSVYVRAGLAAPTGGAAPEDPGFPTEDPGDEPPRR